MYHILESKSVITFCQTNCVSMQMYVNICHIFTFACNSLFENELLSQQLLFLLNIIWKIQWKICNITTYSKTKDLTAVKL